MTHFKNGRHLKYTDRHIHESRFHKYELIFRAIIIQVNCIIPTEYDNVVWTAIELYWKEEAIVMNNSEKLQCVSS